ncbi:MAG: SpoIIE family protein phosphatase, partial [Candidatus Omnitrophica bacterium]|nr:SpoIIE family protein phosphatase [Candidatus Omnitrophota bacterium]
PNQKWIMNETIFSIAESRNDENLRKIGRKMVVGESGFVPFLSFDRNKKSWVYYAPITSTGWTLAVVFPEDELLEDVVNQTLLVCTLGFLGLILLVAVIIVMANSITSPLRKMSKAAEAVGNGDLEAELPMVSSNDEVGLLTQAFANMKISLKEYISKLQETTAAKERIESELSIAREIQVSILPRTFPAFPDRKEFDIYATMEPAKEVGGDFYDFCMIDEKKLYFVIGDVSGKGVPAALFMMIAKTLLKNEALRGSSASEILCNVNNIIALDNSTSMFATVFCGILDIETGELEFSNAGHNPPLFYTQANGFEFLTIIKGFVLGPMPDFTFKSEKIKLNKGDCFFLYTDGVTEAMNPAKELFSEERFLSVSSNLQDQDIRFIVSGVREDITRFVKTEPQSDDITMLILRIN